jgi:hypothetical protein
LNCLSTQPDDLIWSDKTPEQKLIWQIIARAVRDFTQYDRRTKIYRDAEWWLFDEIIKDERPMTLRWCLNHVVEDVEGTIAALHKSLLAADARKKYFDF